MHNYVQAIIIIHTSIPAYECIQACRPEVLLED